MRRWLTWRQSLHGLKMISTPRPVWRIDEKILSTIPRLADHHTLRGRTYTFYQKLELINLPSPGEVSGLCKALLKSLLWFSKYFLPVIFQLLIRCCPTFGKINIYHQGTYKTVLIKKCQPTPIETYKMVLMFPPSWELWETIWTRQAMSDIMS